MVARSASSAADTHIEEPGSRVCSAPKWTLAALLCAGIAAAPALAPGFINTRAGGDSPFLLQRVQQLSVNLSLGIFPARWMPDAAFGLGYPFFDFYAAFPYYLASALHLSGWGVVGGIKLTQLAGFLLAGGAMYVLARRLGSRPTVAVLASVAYTFAPFHLVNVYVRGDALSEFWAYAMFAVVLLACEQLREEPSLDRVPVLAGSYALLVLTHNISALIFSPLLVAWLVGAGLREGRSTGWRVLGLGIAALALGLLLSAWFWLPALREQTLVQLQDQTTGYFHYAGHFRGRDLVQLRALHDYTLDAEHSPFCMNLVQVALATTGLVATAVRGVKTRRLAPAQGLGAITLLLSTWMMTPSSRWLWDRIPLLAYVQFPWRLLSIQALAISLVLTSIDLASWREPGPNGTAAPRGAALRPLILVSVCSAALAVSSMTGLHPDRLQVQDSDITRERLMLYDGFSGNVGTTIRHEYLPREMVPRPYASGVQLVGERKPTPLVLHGALRAAELLAWTPAREDWAIEVAEPTLLAFHTAFYPGWEAHVDMQPQGVEPLPGLGLIGLRLSPGAHRVVLAFTRTRVRRYAGWCSWACLAAWAVLTWRCLSRRRRWPAAAVGMAAVVALFAVGAAHGVVRAKVGRPLSGPLVMDSARAPLLHVEPRGLQFGALHLDDYAVDRTDLVPGEHLLVSLKWTQPLTRYLATVQLVSIAAQLFEPSPVWAVSSAQVRKQSTDLGIVLPTRLAPGIYCLRLLVSNGQDIQVARTRAGQSLGTPVLLPIRVRSPEPSSTQPRLSGCLGDAPDASDSQTEPIGTYGPENVPPEISLLGACATYPQPGLAEVWLLWRGERQVGLNYYLSLRLRRPDGSILASRDLPPFLGAYPTSLWRPGELLEDRVLLRYPTSVGASSGHTFEVVLYDRSTLRAVGSCSIPAGVVPQ